MYLTAMTHRDELFDITLRWMNDDFHPDDGKRITRIFVYESALSIVVIERIMQFLRRLFKEIQERIPLMLSREPGVTVVEIERHSGD